MTLTLHHPHADLLDVCVRWCFSLNKRNDKEIPECRRGFPGIPGPVSSHRRPLPTRQAWQARVALHAPWARLALFALFAVLPPATLWSFTARLPRWARLQAGGR